MFDAAALQCLLLVLTRWLERREREVVGYLIAENRLLRRQLGTRRVRLTDADRRRLAVRAIRVGRRTFREIASIATPDTVMFHNSADVFLSPACDVSSRPVINIAALQMVLGVLTGWLERREREAIAYLIEENRLLRYQLGRRRLRLTDTDRRRLAARAHRVGRATLREIATIATPDTLLRWHRQLIARKWTYGCKPGRRGVMSEIQRLVVRMAAENPTWGYTRIQGALKNVGHRVGRSTIRRILKAAGLPPVPQRPTSWHTFLKAHWGVIAGADFFTTELWTWRGLVTYYTVFVIDLASRRVQILGSTPYPEALFMQQVIRTLTMAELEALDVRVLICDRDRTWSREVRRQLRDADIKVVLTPECAPNANAYAERFVWSIKEECLDRIIPIGERHFRRAVMEFVEHYHRERNHQGLRNALIVGWPPSGTAGRVRRRPRLGGLLNFYERAA